MEKSYDGNDNLRGARVKVDDGWLQTELVRYLCDIVVCRGSSFAQGAAVGQDAHAAMITPIYAAVAAAAGNTRS